MSDLRQYISDRIVVDPESDCWLWQRSTKNGYGRFGDGGRFYAHRESYRAHVGDPGKLWVLHKCDVKRCCNPEHLFLGTHTDNMRDARAKGRDTHSGKTHYRRRSA